MKVGRPELHALAGDRLFEADIEAFTLLRLEIWIRKEIEGRKADE